MPHLRKVTSVLLVPILLMITGFLSAVRAGYAPPPANDNCNSADVITITGGGYDYGVFNSTDSDLTTATGQAGEFFEFASDYGHSKSVWIEFTLTTSRSIRIKLEASAGSILPDPKHSGVTLYSPSNCLPGAGNRLGSIISSGELERYCATPGTYRIQVTAVAGLTASMFVNLTVSCPFDPIYPEVATYDCPERAYIFNSGNPLPQNSATVSGVHEIECHSIEDPSEYNCLPFSNKDEYLKSAWYIFTTGNDVNFLSFDFPVGSQSEQVGYRVLEGNVRTDLFSSLPQVDCGVAEISFNTRFIELPCVVKPNTTYSMAIIFHKDFQYNNVNIRALQRGVASITGWPKPVLPPASPLNELGALPTQTTWFDRFDCSSYISDNICPPANPASGLVIVGSGNDAKSYDLATWATFTLATDANLTLSYAFYHANAEYHTRIFSKTLTGNCPSPDPASDLYYEFSGYGAEIKCIPAGDYSIQVLASSNDTFPATVNHNDSWLNGYLGTRFTLQFDVVAHPSIGLFRLDAPGEYDDINNLNPLQANVTYNSTPAVFICENTVLPPGIKCADVQKAIYREINIGDANGDGIPDDGLLTMSGMRTDPKPDSAIVYQFFKGDANQLATSAGTHAEGQVIPGLIDYAGFCIDQNDSTMVPKGIDTVCACVTSGVYTLTSLGNVDNVGHGDEPAFRFNMYRTIHDSRANSELIDVNVPGTYSSGVDYFSCVDNIGSMPPCGGRRKLVYREFYLPDSAVMIITEVGNAGNVFTLFSGRASDLSSNLDVVADCIIVGLFENYCKPYPPGWYTVVSYGLGPNYTNSKVWVGGPGDVGQTTVINITLIPVVTPNFNRPYKAYQAGITDWFSPLPGSPNVNTDRIYYFQPDTFCAPDTPFIPNQLRPCGPGYNRVAFYVFEITKPSFVQIRNVDPSFYTEVYPFDVSADSASLLTVSPVYPCMNFGFDFRQLCDIPPGKYTIAIFATDFHESAMIAPAIYVEEAALSRFDHVWNAYDFDVVPTTNTFVNGRALDTHPTLPGQAPSRDKFYCTTGATNIDPTETRCFSQLNPLIYAEPPGTPKPLFVPGAPPQPFSPPWRNLWYTFMLTGSGVCTLHTEVLSGVINKPLFAVYESDVDANIPWSTLQGMLNNPGNSIIPGLKLVKDHVDIYCDSETGDLMFDKNGCLRDSVRYYVVVTFDIYDRIFRQNLPNQAITLSIKYNPKPTYAAPYDEKSTANVVNGLIETSPPYTSVPLTRGSTFTGPDFSLLCYTKHVTDPPGCGETGKSAWFKFEVAASGHLYTSLQEIGIPNGWYANVQDMSVWEETDPNGPVTKQLPFNFTNFAGHEWLEGCIDPGTYYLLVRHCSTSIDTLQPYRAVITLVDSPGDFCYNAIPVNVTDFNPVSNGTIIDCHTIGTDIGESLPGGNSCFPIARRKTTWFHVTVTAGTMVDLKFQLGENFTGSATDLSDLAYRILAGTCGAMTPIACSEGNINLTLNCLGQGDYYVQVSLPETAGPNNLDVEGTLSLTVTATPSNPLICMEPLDPNEVNADFTFTSDCQTITFINTSTAGSDIIYLWEFPDGTTSTDANPVWTPPAGSATYNVTLTVTNTVLNRIATVTLQVTINAPFATYTSLSDTTLCNNSGAITLDATVAGATYLWDDNSTDAQRITNTPGTYWVIISKDGCEKKDTAVVTEVNAMRMIDAILCPESSITVGNEVFDINNPTGTVIIPNAHPSGCDSILSVDLNFYSPAESQFSKTICDGESFALGNQNLTQSGIYTDQLISDNGCDSIVTLTLTVTPKQTFDFDVSGCIGASLTIKPTVPGTDYEWSDGSTTDSLNVNNPGTYSVSVTDMNGCLISEETFSVTFGLLSSPNVNVPNQGCIGTDVIVTAWGSSGNYQWYDSPSGGNLIHEGSTLLIQNIQNDTTVYVQAVQIGADTCISERVVVQVDASDEPVQVDSQDTVICAGNTILLPWGEEVLPVTNATFTNSWQYAVSGCDSLILAVNVSLEQTSVELTAFDVTCFEAEDGSISTEMFNGTPPYSYSWNTGDTTSAVTNVAAGMYSVTVTSAIGCIAVGSQSLAEPPDIILDAAKTDLSCFGYDDGSITGIVSGGTPGYQFSLGGNPFQQDPEFGNLSAGSFSLIIVDSKGCMDSISIDLTEPPEIILDLMAISPLCPTEIPEGSITALASGGQPPLMYALGDGAFSSNSEFSNLAPGLYTVTARDIKGCEASSEVEIEPTLLLPLTLTSLMTLQLGDSVQLIPQISFLPDSVVWSPPDGLSCIHCLEPWAMPVQSTDYQIRIWSVEGCLVTAFVRLEVDSDLKIYVPNVFTPNIDGVNDIFTVYARGEVRQVRYLRIFDRWGNGVWQGNDFLPDGTKGWDGLSHNQPAPSGVYAWVCEIELIDGTKKVLHGDVTLVR